VKIGNWGWDAAGSVDSDWTNQDADGQVMPTSSSVGERRRVDWRGTIRRWLVHMLFNS
jgi:hypothetical protein